MSLAKTNMAYCSALPLKFFFYIITVVFIYRSIYALKIQILILFQNRDPQTDMFCLLINFWKQCCGFIVIINRFLLQMVHFFSHIELKWKFGLRVYVFIHVSVAQRHKFPMGKIGLRTRKKKKEKILLLKCHLSPFMIVCMGSMSIQEMALLP